QLQRVLVMSDGQVELAFFEIEVREVEVGVGHAGVDAGGFTVRLDGQVGLSLALVDQAEVVIALASVNVELNAAAQDRDSVVELIEAVVDGPEVDVSPRAKGIQPRNFLEVVRGGGQVVQQKTDSRQPVMDIRRVGPQPQRLKIQLPRQLVLALRNGSLG